MRRREAQYAGPRNQMRSDTSIHLQPTIGRLRRTRWAFIGLSTTGIGFAAAPQTIPRDTPAVLATNCLESGDGYLRARLGGAIEARIDWPNSGTRCQGEPKDKPPGVRLSFQRVAGGSPDLLFVFGITGVREGRPARAAGVNLTVIVQGTNRIYGTLGDSRCTVDSLTQRPLTPKGSYRVEARGFCTQPAHAVRGNDAVLVSTFEFAGLVAYDAQNETSLGQMTAK
jgi:hypothetical protein